MTQPPDRPQAHVIVPLPQQATERPDARLMRLPERVSAYMRSRSRSEQVYISTSLGGSDAELKSLSLAIQYASRATSLIQETQSQTGELLSLVHKIRSVARRMTLPDLGDSDRKQHQAQLNELWAEAGKFSELTAGGFSAENARARGVEMAKPDGKNDTAERKQLALSKLDEAVSQLERQRNVLDDTAAGVTQTIDLLTRASRQTNDLKAAERQSLSFDHIEKTAEMMAMRAEVTKSAQKEAATEMFANIFKNF